MSNRPEQLVQLSLSDRQRQVLALVAQGFGSKEIARELSLSIRTVDNHLRDISTRLCARSRAHAVAIALRDRLLD